MRTLNRVKSHVFIVIVFSWLIASWSMAAKAKKSVTNEFTQNGLLSQLCVIQDYENKRTSSTDPNGENMDLRFIDAGKTHIMLEEKGPGQAVHRAGQLGRPGRLARFQIDRRDPASAAGDHPIAGDNQGRTVKADLHGPLLGQGESRPRGPATIGHHPGNQFGE